MMTDRRGFFAATIGALLAPVVAKATAGRNLLPTPGFEPWQEVYHDIQFFVPNSSPIKSLLGKSEAYRICDGREFWLQDNGQWVDNMPVEEWDHSEPPIRFL